uniref:Protein kinase domain-containing protein n=1 Tax=Moniliophthora roreri TaxID=221103 RepID=A0A0W0FCQ1_MONRR
MVRNLSLTSRSARVQESGWLDLSIALALSYATSDMQAVVKDRFDFIHGFGCSGAERNQPLVESLMWFMVDWLHGRITDYELAMEGALLLRDHPDLLPVFASFLKEFSNEIVNIHVNQDHDIMLMLITMPYGGQIHIISPRPTSTIFFDTNRLRSLLSSEDIWTGWKGDRRVCLKVLRTFATDEIVIKEFYHEALIWAQLHHPNILPLTGVNEQLFAPRPCLVSPWMSNGNVNEFLKAFPETDRLTFMCEIASGIAYLHQFSPIIVHGDIKGANILVTDDIHCCLADFGLALAESDSEYPGSQSAASSAFLRGSTRWLSPEYLDPSLFYSIQPKTRDVYAFGCTIYEIITGEIPFPHLKYDVAVISEVLRGIRPRFSISDLGSQSYSADFWQLIEQCWAGEPGARPTAEYLAQTLDFYRSFSRLQNVSN